jgi:leucyl/phenylalanyl-tRNA--protein transferase
MAKFLRKTCFKVMFDTAFRQVINLCAEVRCGDTWITRGMKESYIRLHELGFAHSVEVYDEGELVGGLYGVSAGRCFFGESMFSLKDNASKTALITLCHKLSECGFVMVDCQVPSAHLESMGAVNIPRQEFLVLLEQGLCGETIRGSWTGVFSD